MDKTSGFDAQGGSPRRRASWRSPKEALGWLFDDFLYTDLATLTGTERDHLTDLVADFAIGARQATVSPEATFNLEDLQRAQRLVREMFEKAPSRLGAHVALEPVKLSMYLGPRPAVREPAPLILSWNLQATLPTLVALAALAHLERTRLSLLRRCPYPVRRDRAAAGAEVDEEEVCGRIFIGRARQKWCLDHQMVVRREQDRLAQERRRQRMAGKRSPPRQREKGRKRDR